MIEQYKEIVNRFIHQSKTIATMESCTGGGVSNMITNIEGASEILKFSAVTYSNEYKIKMGVSADVISQYTVYSMETAREMAYHISSFANSDYGIGITGKLNRSDVNNPYAKDNVVFISIYDKILNRYIDKEIEVDKKTRKENKDDVIEQIGEMLLSILTE